MSGDLSRQTREATDTAVLAALRTADDTGMMPGELATAVPSISTRTISTSLIRLAVAGQIRRDSERGRAYALPIHDDGSPMSAEDIAAEAAARHARFLAQRDSDVAKVETIARVDLRKLDPQLRHIATGRSTYLLRFAETLRQCTTQSAYDAVSRAFDADFTEIEAKWSQAQLELQQEKDRQKALEDQQREWAKQRTLATKQRKALPAGNPGIQRQNGKASKKHARMTLDKSWKPPDNQVLLPQTAPPNAQRCQFCNRDQYPNPAMYWIIGPLFLDGIGLCHHHAEGERHSHGTQVYLIRWG